MAVAQLSCFLVDWWPGRQGSVDLLRISAMCVYGTAGVECATGGVEPWGHVRQSPPAGNILLDVVV